MIPDAGIRRRESLVRRSQCACEEADATVYTMQTLHEEEKSRLELELKRAVVKGNQLEKEIDEKDEHINFLEKTLLEKEGQITLLEDELKKAQANVRRGKIIEEKFGSYKENLKKMADAGLGERKKEKTQALRQQAFEEKFNSNLDLLRGLSDQSHVEITTRLADVAHVVQATSTSVNSTTSQVLEKVSVLEQVLWDLRESTLHRPGGRGAVNAENITLMHEKHVADSQEVGKLIYLSRERSEIDPRNVLYEKSSRKTVGRQVALCSEADVIDAGQGHSRHPGEETELFTHAMSTYLEDLKKSTAEYSSKLLTLDQGIQDIHDLMLRQNIGSTKAHADHQKETNYDTQVTSTNSVSTQTEESEEPEPKQFNAAQVADKINISTQAESSACMQNSNVTGFTAGRHGSNNLKEATTLQQTHASELDSALSDSQTLGTRWRELLQVAQAGATERHMENPFGHVPLPSFTLFQEQEMVAKLVKARITYLTLVKHLANFRFTKYYILAAKNASPKCILMVLSVTMMLFFVVGLGDLCAPRVCPQEGLELRQDSIASLVMDAASRLAAD